MKTIALLVAMGMLHPVVGLACSVSRIALPEELVLEAETIILAEVTGEAREPASKYYQNVEFKVLAVLKGTYKEITFRTPGTTTKYDGPNDQKQIPYTFVRPGGRHGNCFAMDYKIGKTFLLMLKDNSPNWSPLAPTNEEVSGADDPWVKWVKQELETNKAPRQKPKEEKPSNKAPEDTARKLADPQR